MKKLLFLLLLVLAITMMYGHKNSAQNKKVEKYAKQAIPIDLKGINKHMPESRPGILLFLTNYRSKAGVSTSFLWNYLYANSGKIGC